MAVEPSKKNWTEQAFGPIMNPVFLMLIIAPVLALGYVWFSQNVIN